MFHARNSFPKRFKQQIRLYSVETVNSHYIGTTTQETLVGVFECIVLPLSPKLMLEENLNQSKIYYSVFIDTPVAVSASYVIEYKGEKFKQDIPPKEHEGMKVLRIVNT